MREKIHLELSQNTRSFSHELSADLHFVCGDLL